jgi:ABC-type antimicrobial peptide transport system permease subunit
MQEKKPSKTGAIIGTIAAVLLCGCPGLIACVFGALIAFGVPFNTTVNGYTSQQTFPVGYGIGLLCLSIIFVAIPIVVGVLTLRKKKVVAPADVLPPSEPLPPAA